MGKNKTTGGSYSPKKSGPIEPIVSFIRSKIKVVPVLIGGAVLAATVYWLTHLEPPQPCFIRQIKCDERVEVCRAILQDRDSLANNKACRVYCETILAGSQDPWLNPTKDNMERHLHTYRQDSTDVCYLEIRARFERLLCTTARESRDCVDYREYLSFFGEKGIFAFGKTGYCAAAFRDSIKLDEEMGQEALRRNNCDLYINYLSFFGVRGCYSADFIDRVSSDYCNRPMPFDDDCDRVRQAGTCQAYRSYIKNFPNGRCRDEFLQKIAAECNPGPCDEAKKEDTCEAYLQYLARFPDGLCSADFKALLEQKQCEDQAACEQARALDTCQAYRQYLARFPNGLYADEFKAILAERKCEEQAACDNASRTKSCAAYKNYLQKYPEGACAAEFRKYVKDNCTLCRTENGIAVIDLGPLSWTQKNVKGWPSSAVPYPTEAERDEFGQLFTWEEARRACRKLGAGWRLPCEMEAKYLIGQAESGYYKPEQAFQHLTSPKECGFNAKLGGFSPNGKMPFYAIGTAAYFWCATEFTDTKAWAFGIDLTRGTASPQQINKDQYLSCRCVKEVPEKMKDSWLKDIPCNSR